MRDLVYHLLTDAQRALVALHTPAEEPADRDAVTYWQDAASRCDLESRGLRATRTMASAWRLDHLIDTYVATSRAVLRAVDAARPNAVVATQGHALRVEDLAATLAVEAAVHSLDLNTDVEFVPAPPVMALVRHTLDGLLGHPGPSEWDDLTYVLIGTGRRAPTEAERRALGPAAAQLPLLA